MKKIMYLEAIVLPYLFDKKNSFKKNIHNKKHKKINIKLNKAILNSTLDRLKKYIKKLKPTSYKSIWSSYEYDKLHYSEKDNLVKKNFVKISLEFINLKHNENYILDCGSNTGEFSKIASDLNYKVLAIDFDEQSLNSLLIKKYLNINTAKINIANPTPGIGWKNKEIRSFLERSEKKFLCTLFLGIIHHLTVTDRIPIDEILKLICSLSIKFSIIEFISNKDPKFIQIAKSNNHLYKYFDENYFENNTKIYFDIIDKKKINKTRSIYFLKKLET